MDIIEDLHLEADMAENLGSPGDGAMFLRAIAEIRKLRESLHDANEMCRSTAQIAKRNGEETDWANFKARLDESLARQHAVMHGVGSNTGDKPRGEATSA